MPAKKKKSARRRRPLTYIEWRVSFEAEDPASGARTRTETKVNGLTARTALDIAHRETGDRGGTTDMAISATIDDPRHYTARDGRVLPVSGTHERGADCARCDFVPKRPVNFMVGQRVVYAYGKRRGIEGIVSKIGRRYVTILSTTKAGRRREVHRLASEIVPAAQAVRA
jgi:hypothetical protein